MITMVGAELGEGPHPRKGTHYGRNRGRGRTRGREHTAVGMLMMTMMMMITLRAEPGEGHTYGAHRYKRRVALTRTGARVRVERAVNVPEAALHRAALTAPQAERTRVRCAR